MDMSPAGVVPVFDWRVQGAMAVSDVSCMAGIVKGNGTVDGGGFKIHGMKPILC